MPSRDSKLQVVSGPDDKVAAVAQAWPRCATLEDEALVTRTSLEIRAILGRTVAQGLEEVGQIILREFYNNDPAIYRSASHHKHASLRLLVQRCETMDPPIRRTVIANAIQMASLIRELPAHSPFLQLPPTHRVELLRAGSPERVHALAGRALEENMTVKKVKETVRKVRTRRKPKRGRKQVPPLLMTLRGVVKMLRDKSTGRLAFRRDEVDSLDEAQLAEARAHVDTASKRIEELLKLLG